jgi:hypothetical protein
VVVGKSFFYFQLNIIVNMVNQNHASIFPILAKIAMDVCAVPASSVPCERLFSAGAETATNCRSRLGSNQFEQLQVMKFAWRKSVVDHTASNSLSAEEVLLTDFTELLHQDDETVEWEHREDEVAIGPY